MHNIYHIVHFKPGIERWEMSIGHEDLAQRLVLSGRFRIDCGEDKINFARFYIPNLNISMMFSYREIYDSKLLHITRETIALQLSNFISSNSLKKKVDFYLGTLEDEMKKYAQPTLEEEIKLARLVVQAAHPAVFELLLFDRVEIFLSYSHEIGDVLDIQTWQTSGKNSGMQSLSGKDKSIFISCGGDPLKPNKDPKAEYGDGKPAIARILIIGGQEIGHYSDIRRDNKTGQQIPDRYSADIYGTHPKKEIKFARIMDIKRCNFILDKFSIIGLHALLKTEKAIKFYKEVNRGGLALFLELVKLNFKKTIFLFKARNLGLHKILEKFKNEKYQATMLDTMIKEMLFNLEPKADVYSSEDKDEEEAIACIEAIARVPQQVNKWGHYLTNIYMKNLYEIYYKKIIPECIHACKILSGKSFIFNNNRIGRSFFETVKSFFKSEI